MKKQHIFKALVCSIALCTVMSLGGCTRSNTQNSSTSSDVNSTEEISKVDYKDPEYTLSTIVTSGECGKNGDNVTYQLDEEGLLLISGSGNMSDHNGEKDFAPWYSYREKIKTIIVKNGVTSIGEFAFYNCTNATSITIPYSVTIINGYAFRSCESITRISIPDSVTSIGNEAFEYCKNLTSITLPKGLTKVDYWIFQDCKNLTSVEIPDSVTSISGGAFGGCKSLKNLIIPDNVEYIGDQAFEGCTSLTSVTIPEKVKTVDRCAFQHWTSSQTINIKGKSSAPSNWHPDWKMGCEAKIVWNA